MCRLVLMNKEGEKEIERAYGLENYFKYLETSLGGHGNGYALLKKGKVIDFCKGTNLSVKEIARVIRKKKYDWCIFHTRLASVGILSDRNCHPFIRNNSEVMAMNGTEHTIDFLSEPLGITDTEAILDTKVTYNLELPALRRFNSIFVGFSKGNPYVVANNTYNIKLFKNFKKEAIIFASSFPETIKKNVYIPLAKFIWNGGEINMLNFEKYEGIKFYQDKIKNTYYKSFFVNDDKEDNEQFFKEQDVDCFDYYSDFYEKYDKEIGQYNKVGEKIAA